MANRTKLICALTLSSLSNNTKRWLSAYLKGRTASCRYNFTLSPSFHARVRSLRVPVYPLPYSTSLPPHSPNPTTFSPTPMLMTSLFSVDQIAETFTAHLTNIEELADEGGLAISAPKSAITLFTPQFAQSHTHPQVTLNKSILPLERTPCILE